MSDDSPAPTPRSDEELRETVELMSKVVALMSDRIDEQTKVLKDLDGTLAEVRSATFIAAEQTDPKRYGELVGATIDGKINDNLVRMGKMCVDLLQASNRAQEVLAKAETDKSIALRQLWQREQKLERWTSRWPWFGLGVLVLALAMTLTLPGLLATTKFICDLMVGYTWTTTTTGTHICVRYND